MSDHDTNFFFLLDEFASLAEDAIKAERAMFDYPDVSFILSRRAIENLVIWLYKNDNRFMPPNKTFQLNEFLNAPSFRKSVDEHIYDKLKLIQKHGNDHAHSKQNRTNHIQPIPAQKIIEELLRVFAWFEQHYGKPNHDRKTRSFKVERVKKSTLGDDDIKAIKDQAEQEQAKLTQALHAHQELIAKKDAQILALQEQIAQTLAQNKARIAEHGDPNDYKESETRALLIDIMLSEAGWVLGTNMQTEVSLQDMPTSSGMGRADYVLYDNDGKPLAVVEAKRSLVSPEQGQHQAKLYADSLEQQYGTRPIIYYSNGYQTMMWDDVEYPPRAVSGFYRQEELKRLILRRNHDPKPLANHEINTDIAGRDYQIRAVKSLLSTFDDKKRKGLLIMATGTGKTRTAIALVDVLGRADRIKNVLFLADRTALVRQAHNNFKALLPNMPCVNLIENKSESGRIYFATYHTMMNLIDEYRERERVFGVGFFDLIIIDEAHRSVYQKFGHIFDYFDSLLVGLTATPRDEVDRDTYALFDLPTGSPTDYYHYEEAVKAGHLVDYRLHSIPTKFVRDGVKYNELSDEEKAHWDALDWGDERPEEVSAYAVNKLLYNADTVDKVLAYLMEHGIKVDGGDTLGKTIIFADNQKHAEFIAERFNHHYPKYKGHFAQVITHATKYAQSLIDDFSQKDKSPQIAISVDMLDTGIDVPEVVNLVFFKTVRSSVKFWQMIGRGTRLCPDLFAPDVDKHEFLIFDVCQNFEYFSQNPKGKTASPSESLSKRLFKAQAQLAYHLQNSQNASEQNHAKSLKQILQKQVDSMNPDNFMVRANLQYVDYFKQPDNWQTLTDTHLNELNNHVAGLPDGLKMDKKQLIAKRFDVMCYHLQLAIAQQKTNEVVAFQKQLMPIVHNLRQKAHLSTIKPVMALLDEMTTPSFWEGVTVMDIERVRQSLRKLIELADKQATKVVYTYFDDEITPTPATSLSFSHVGVDIDGYKQRVKDFIHANEDHLTIAKLRAGNSLTPSDLQALEDFVYNAQEVQNQAEFEAHFGHTMSLPDFIRSLVGLDHKAVRQAFSAYLTNSRYNERQIRFVEMIIDELTKQGKLKPERLYEPPFNQIHTSGIDGVFQDSDVGIIFNLLEHFNDIKVS